MTVEPTGRERLVDLGLTDAEIDLWYDLGALAGRFLELPTLHPNERGETVVEFHHAAEPSTRSTRSPGSRLAPRNQLRARITCR